MSEVNFCFSSEYFSYSTSKFEVPCFGFLYSNASEIHFAISVLISSGRNNSNGTSPLSKHSSGSSAHKGILLPVFLLSHLLWHITVCSPPQSSSGFCKSSSLINTLSNSRTYRKYFSHS